MRKKLTLIFGLALILPAAMTGATARFVGSDGNWFEPGNWSTGRVPLFFDDVVIPQNTSVRILPELGWQWVWIKDLEILDGGQLTTEPGTVWTARNETLLGGSLIHRSTQASLSLGGRLESTAGGFGSGGLQLNPTPKSKRDVILKTSVSIGIGGTQPSSLFAFGQGTYSTITADKMQIDGNLAVEFLYGFTPRIGDRFVIFRAERIVGRFRNIPTSGLVMQIGNVGIFLETSTREHVLLARPM